MVTVNGSREFERRDRGTLPAEERLESYEEFTIPLPKPELSRQGARCLDCGTPYCHSACPVDNVIPDWNELVHRGDWRLALDVLHSTNNFPEFTGRVCPAPCEEACTLNLVDAPVTIKTIEHAIIERAWAKRWIKPAIPARRTDRSVAVIGSGPAGLAAAQQLARAGHHVVVYEKNAKIGGLLRYGIPDFKLAKRTIDRRMSQMMAEGVEFRVNRHIGVDVSLDELWDRHDAIVLAGGAEQPRDLPVPGRDLDGVHFAMDYLTQQNRRNGGEPIGDVAPITAEGRHVVVIGGGDTGSDCVGIANRQGAASVTQLELLPKPPVQPNKLLVWPEWPNRLRTSSSHEEGCERMWSVSTTEFLGDGRVKSLSGVEVDWRQENAAWQMSTVEGSDFVLQADLVLLAMGFTGPSRNGLVDTLGIDLDERGNVAADISDYATSVEGVFAAGDMRRGQSLVVWAIREGRRCARAVDQFLMGESRLPR